jgi:cytochrome c
MSRIFRSVVVFSLIIMIFACGKKSDTSRQRPLDHWVFRSVLDLKPRIITMALSDRIWAAYSTRTGALYKAWKGTVLFDGPVYTTAHGPQPISIGDAYLENKFEQPWSVIGTDGQPIETVFQYKGHRFVKDQVELMYALTSQAFSAPVRIYEKVEASVSDSGQPVFERTFTTENVPEGFAVLFTGNASSIVAESNIDTDGKMEITTKEDVQLDKISGLNLDFKLKLNSNAATKLNIKFLVKPAIPNNNIAGGMEEEEEENPGGVPEGLKLIAKSDCKTCHNKNRKTVGPSYVAIAEKYVNNPENLALLASKIKHGGSGVWGNVQMTPHPDLPDEDIESMVKYILSLDDDAGQVAETQNIKTDITPDTTIDENEFLPGSLVSVYMIPSNTKTMPVIKPGSKARYAGIMANFDNLSGNDFKELSDNFMITGEGYIKVDTAGTYLFHIWSDDGSVLYLGGKKVIDNDGLHGAEYGEVALTLEKGYYPFRLEYFQGGGGKFLSFNWKKPGHKDFEVISPFSIYHTRAMQSKLGDLTLPMAAVSKVPGDAYPLTDVHPSFDLTQARPDSFEPKVGGMDFLSDGRMVVSTWDPAGSVYIVDGVHSGDSTKMSVKRIAFGLAEPLGLKVVNDTIYVMQKQEMTRLIDSDNDDLIDEYQTLTDQWEVSANFHEFGFGLEYKEGYFYATLATAINPGGASTQPQIQDRGKVIKVNKNTGETEFIASGLRTPNGIGIGYNGELFVADNQGDWLPSSKIVHITPGAWYGSRSVDPEGTKELKEKPPVVWLPQDEIGNSPSTPSYINVGPYKGQMIHGEVTHGGVKRVFVEEVDGELQGCVFRFIQGLEAGVNRLCWGPGGDLYIGGIGNPGNWGQSGKLHYGLQRLKYNGKSTFEMLAVRAKTNGVEIEFTEALQGTDGWNPAHFTVKQWYYKPTIEYGGPKLDERKLEIVSSTVSDDRKKVFLELIGMKPGHVLYVHLKKHFISESGNAIRSTDAWYTMNRIPANTMGVSKKSPYTFANNTLTDQEKAAGWVLLFDGKTLNGWRNFKKQTIGKSWIVNQESIHLDARPDAKGGWQAPDGGDIITDKEYENYEFSLEWKISNCGNSGIIFNVVESDQYDYVWQTGPEMQVLDNTCHPDARIRTHRAGDLYDMIETSVSTVKPAGEWNEARIRSVNGKVDFWLNGYNVVSFEMHTDAWKKMVAASKFKDMPGFGLAKKGHISLQDHGDKVWYRNIKIREVK